MNKLLNLGTINNSTRKRNKRNTRAHCLSTVNTAGTRILIIPTFTLKKDSANDKRTLQTTEGLCKRQAIEEIKRTRKDCTNSNYALAGDDVNII